MFKLEGPAHLYICLLSVANKLWYTCICVSMYCLCVQVYMYMRVCCVEAKRLLLQMSFL